MANIGAMVQALQSAGFFSYLLPWLLTLAITYGLMEHYDIPRSKSARAVIAIVIAFFVLPTAAVIEPFLTGLVKGFVVLVSGALIAVIFIEVTGIKAADKETIFEKHPREFAIVLLIIAALIFIGAGGLDILGWRFSVGEGLLNLLFFLAIMVVGVWFIATKGQQV